MDNNVYAEYGIDRFSARELGYFVSNTQVFSVDKPKFVTNVCFIDNEKNVTAVPFGTRNLNSPSSVFDMLKNYTGVYKGTLPGANGEMIFTELNLKTDYTYTLKQKYLTVNGKTFTSLGNWLLLEDVNSFILNNKKDLIFYFINKNTIEKLDNNGEKIDLELYKLKK
jgi:hypothetical protein